MTEVVGSEFGLAAGGADAEATEAAGEVADEPDVVNVVGVAVPADQATATVARPHVVIVTSTWGANWNESAAATRLVAGALALGARVSIVSLEDRSNPKTRQPRIRYDGLFPVHSVATPPTSSRLDQRADLLRTALLRQPGQVLTEIGARRGLAHAALPSTDAILTTVGLFPDVVILAGKETFWLGAALPVGPDRPRVVLLPLCGDDPVLSSAAFQPLARMVDAIGVFSHLEYDRIRAVLSDDPDPADPDPDPAAERPHAERPDAADRLHLLEIALPINRLAASAGMAGVAAFGPYVLVISSFVEDGTVAAGPPHDYFRQMVGDVAIAEVRRSSWVVTAPGKRFDITWAPSRMNVWRLMARAALTVDLRRPGAIGREAIESLRFGTPIVVPANSVPAEHAARANGGLWYRNHGELIACVRTLLDDDALRSALGASGEAWADQHHGGTDMFVDQVLAVVLSPGMTARSASARGVS